MKKTLHMVCPHCKLKAELNIQEEAEMILMRCVSCDSPYLYFHGETFEVNESEMDHLKEAEMKEVEGFLKINDDDEEPETIEELNSSTKGSVFLLNLPPHNFFVMATPTLYVADPKA